MAYVDSMQTQLLLDTIANGSTVDTVMRDLLVYHTPLSDTVLSAYINRTSGVTPASFQTVLLRNVPASKTVWDLLTTEFDSYSDDETDWVGVIIQYDCFQDQLQTDRVMFHTSDPAEHSRERGFSDYLGTRTAI